MLTASAMVLASSAPTCGARHLPGSADQSLGLSECEGRARGQFRRQSSCALFQDGILDDLRHQAPLQRLTRGQGSVREGQGQGALLTDGARQEVGDSAVRRQPDPGIGGHESRGLRRNDDVAAEHDCQSGAGHRTLHRSDRGFVERCQLLKGAVQGSGQGQDVRRPIRCRDHGGDVSSRTEPLAGARHEDGTHSVVPCGSVDDGVELVSRRQVHRVRYRGTVQLDVADAGDLAVEHALGHHKRSMMVALAMPPPSHMVWRP